MINIYTPLKKNDQLNFISNERLIYISRTYILKNMSLYMHKTYYIAFLITLMDTAALFGIFISTNHISRSYR